MIVNCHYKNCPFSATLLPLTLFSSWGFTISQMKGFVGDRGSKYCLHLHGQNTGPSVYQAHHLPPALCPIKNFFKFITYF